jgi:hypothetical protein
MSPLQLLPFEHSPPEDVELEADEVTTGATVVLVSAAGGGV